MQVTEVENKGLKRVFKIAVGAEQIRKQTEEELKAAGERVKIPGFRPGFIPMKVLQQRYGKAVEADVIKQVISRASGQALSERKLRPVGTPKVDIEKDYKEGGDLTFTMALEIFPPVPAVAFDQITLERPTFEVDEAAIDEAAARISERSPNFERAKEGAAAEKGHVVVIDFKGMIDGVAFDGGTASNFRLELGSGQFIAGFEDQLLGAKEGEERLVKVTFPKEYHAENLAGKPATFEVKVNEIHHKELPVVDDKFAKDRGFADLRALREAIRSQLIKEYDQVVRTRLKKQLFDHLEEAVDFELPESMIEVEFKVIWERLQEAKKYGDPSIAGKSDEELKEEYEQIARRRVKLGILLADVGTQHNIVVNRDELGRAAMQQASQYPGQERQVMEFYKNHPDRLEDLRGPILEEKAVDFILGKATFNDTKVTLEALMQEDEPEKNTSGAKPKSAKKNVAAKSDETKSAPKKKATKDNKE